MEIEISKLINERNQALWDEVTSKYQVDFQISSNSEYACYTQNKTAIFSIPINNYCPDSFTHELLHVYMKIKEVGIGAYLIYTISANNDLNKIFVDRLLEHISNCLDHIKMLPIYLQMGFERSKFILDYHKEKCTDREARSIKKNYKNGNRYNIRAVEAFIGKFFAIKADPNPNFNYKRRLSKLKKIDEQLFNVLDEFMTGWENYDIDKFDVFNNYRDLVDEFYEKLKSWMSGKLLL